MSQPDNLARSLVSLSSLAICYEYQGTWSTLNLGKVACGVVTEENKPAHRLNLVFIEREGVLVLRRCCLHWRMRKFLGNIFFSLSGRITKNIAGFMPFSRMGNKSFLQTITIVISRYFNVCGKLLSS